MNSETDYTENEEVNTPEQTIEPEKELPEDSGETSEIKYTPETIANMSEEELNNLTPEMITNGSSEPTEPTEKVEPDNQEQGNAPEQPNELDNTTLSDEDFRRLITSPFKANNVQVQVKKPEDVIKFMQMGMNYQKKLAGIRPHLGALKSLEQNGLLDNEKISFMVDLMQGKPEAIAQFLKDKEVDTYNLPDIEETPYKPSNHIPSAEQLTFDETISELQETDTGRRVIQDLREWDTQSISEVYNNPKLLNTLNSHVENGLYEDTISILTREKALGNIPENTSIIDAYDEIATQLLRTQGDKYQSQPSTQNQPVVVGNNLQTQPRTINQNPAKKQASMPTGSQGSNNFNFIDPLTIANMTDDEIAKYGSFDELISRFKR